MDQSLNDDSANIDESLRSEEEGVDINCRRVSSNFSTCSSITHDFQNSMLDWSFSTSVRSTEEEAEGKYSGEYLQWTQQCLVELEQHNVMMSPPTMTPRKSLRKKLQRDLMMSPPTMTPRKSLRNKLLSPLPPLPDDETSNHGFLSSMEQYHSDLMMSPPTRTPRKSLRKKLLSPLPPLPDDETSSNGANHNRRTPTSSHTLFSPILSPAVANPPPPTVDDEQQAPTPRMSNHRKQLAPASSTDANRPTVDRTISCDDDDGSASETPSGIASFIVEELGSSNSDFTWRTIESDEDTPSIPLDDLPLLLEKEPSCRRLSLNSTVTILKSNRTGTSVANNTRFVQDEQPIGDLGDDEPSASSYDDSTLYEVASLDTKREGNARDDVQTNGNLGDDDELSAACSCDDSTLYEVASLDTKREGNARDDEQTIGSLDDDELSAACSCDDSTLYEVASLVTLDTKPEILGEVELSGEQKTNRATLAVAHDDSDHKNTSKKKHVDHDASPKGVQAFDHRWRTSNLDWKEDEVTESTYDMDSSESFLSPIATHNGRTLLSIQLPRRS